jgi:hypothetical protein
MLANSIHREPYFGRPENPDLEYGPINPNHAMVHVNVSQIVFSSDPFYSK